MSDIDEQSPVEDLLVTQPIDPFDSKTMMLGPPAAPVPVKPSRRAYVGHHRRTAEAPR